MGTGKEYGREVQKLKRTCKLASITVPPSVYTRVTEEQDVVDRLKALLQKHGLSEQATSDEIAQVRNDLQKQRDLEGDILHPCQDLCTCVPTTSMPRCCDVGRYSSVGGAGRPKGWSQVVSKLFVSGLTAGIDMNNILGEGRGRRAAAAAPRKYNYADSGNSSDSDAEDVCRQVQQNAFDSFPASAFVPAFSKCVRVDAGKC